MIRHYRVVMALKQGYGCFVAGFNYSLRRMHEIDDPLLRMPFVNVTQCRAYYFPVDSVTGCAPAHEYLFAFGDVHHLRINGFTKGQSREKNGDKVFHFSNLFISRINCLTSDGSVPS